MEDTLTESLVETFILLMLQTEGVPTRRQQAIEEIARIHEKDISSVSSLLYAYRKKDENPDFDDPWDQLGYVDHKLGNNVHSRVKIMRIAFLKSKKKLARVLQISNEQYNKKENGALSFAGEEFAFLSRYYKVPVEYFTGQLRLHDPKAIIRFFLKQGHCQEDALIQAVRMMIPGSFCKQSFRENRKVLYKLLKECGAKKYLGGGKVVWSTKTMYDNEGYIRSRADDKFQSVMEKVSRAETKREEKEKETKPSTPKKHRHKTISITKEDKDIFGDDIVENINKLLHINHTWVKKNEKLEKDNEELAENNKTLTQENEKLRAEFSTLQTRLNKTEEELAETKKKLSGGKTMTDMRKIIDEQGHMIQPLPKRR